MRTALVIENKVYLCVFAGLLNAFLAISTPAEVAPLSAGIRHGSASPLVLAQLNTNAQIYLLRGLANVFSTGLDDLAEKLKQKGYNPQVINWKFSSSAADSIASNYRNGQKAPIILIGHSLGANALIPLADSLRQKNIPVAYMVSIDPTEPQVLPSNVQLFVNFYLSNGGGKKVSEPAGYKGKLMNIDVSDRAGVTHTNMDESAQLHEIVIGQIMRTTMK